jgi:hypothetical protein
MLDDASRLRAALARLRRDMARIRDRLGDSNETDTFERRWQLVKDKAAELDARVTCWRRKPSRPAPASCRSRPA